MIETAKRAFEVDGFKVFTTDRKYPDMILCGEHGEFYAVEVLTDPKEAIIWEKIEKYLTEDIDGLYFIIPRHNPHLIELFCKKKVTFISISELLGVDTTYDESDNIDACIDE